jgi:hypothetical protein
MLDYAANAVAYWPLETIRSKYEARCEAEASDGVHILADFLKEYLQDECL